MQPCTNPLYELTSASEVTLEDKINLLSKLTIIGSDNGLSPGQPQAVIWTNAVILLIQTLVTDFSEILSEIHIFSFNKSENIFCEMVAILLGLNVLDKSYAFTKNLL